jgi:hypothetical protein
MSAHPRWAHWHAVVRVDTAVRDPELAYTIVKVFRSPDDAVSEVTRLNALSPDPNCLYFVQLARLEQEGPSEGA